MTTTEARTPGASTIRARIERARPWLLLLAASFLFRLPSLVNASGTNCDAAVVGLQAMQILRGEWSWFLWGSGYQTSVDALVAAAVFLFTGPSPLALMLSTLVGHVALTWLVYDVLRRRTSSTVAAILAALLVFTAGPIHTYVLYPPRQASLTLAFLGFWLADGAVHGGAASGPTPRAGEAGASSSRRPFLRLAAGAAVGSLAVYADPYALLFLPAIALLSILGAMDDRPPRPVLLRRLGAALAGGALGMIPYQLLIRHPLATRGQTSLTRDVLAHNWQLLWDSCLPWALSYKVYAAKVMSDYQPWETGGGYHAFQVIAAIAIMAGILSGGALFFVRRIPWEVRRLGLVGAVMVPGTIGGFLLSPMVMDHFSSRYLVAMLLTAPFALAPLASLLRPRHLALALAPYLFSSAVSGWISYRPFTLAVHPSLAADERLGVALRERGIHHAVADYWASYRLTLLYREDPIVVPTSEVEDRYRRYRDRVEAAEVIAYVYDPYRSRENLAEKEKLIREGKTRYEPSYDRFEVDRFTVLVLRKKEETRVAARR